MARARHRVSAFGAALGAGRWALGWRCGFAASLTVAERHHEPSAQRPAPRAGAKRPGFTLIEAICAVAILGVGAAGGAAAWSICTEMNHSARAMQAETNILEQELERVRRLNWSGLSETPDWVEHMAYDVEGNPLGPAATTRPSGRGYVSVLKAEPLSEETLKLRKKWRVDWVLRSTLRRVTVRVRQYPFEDTKPPAAETVTYLASEGF